MFHITDKAQECREGSTFIAQKGRTHHGLKWISQALKNGATRVICNEEISSQDLEDFFKINPLAKIEVFCGPQAQEQFQEQLHKILIEAFGDISQKIKLIGITGTSGKTSTSIILTHLLNSVGIRTAYLGTLGAKYLNNAWETSNTTPSLVWIYQFLFKLLELGAEVCVMEISSHALDQNRVYGLKWEGAAFLNLSHEHLDYHASLEDYFNAKKKLFLKHSVTTAYVAQEDEYGRRLTQELTQTSISKVEPVLTSQCIKNAQFNNYGISGEYISKNKDSYALQCPLFGKFQLNNLAVALTIFEDFIASIQQLSLGIKSLTQFKGVPGRMEWVPSPQGCSFQVIVDYAHKPEALKSVLESLMPASVITVFGCGGDRDRTKRSLMSSIVAQHSRWCILTSDNPRTENQEQIFKDMLGGLKNNSNYEIIEDRKLAIQKALLLAQPDEVVLIAGKGHEAYQIIGQTTHPFDDRLIAQEFLKEITHSK